MAQAMPSYSPDGEKEAIANACRTNLAQLYEVTGGSTFIAGENLTYLDFAYHELLDVLNEVVCHASQRYGGDVQFMLAD
jgi:hypothetical protein